MAVATAFAVAACSSDADNSAAPAAGRLTQRACGRVAGSTAAAGAGERFVEPKIADAYTPAPPEGAVDEYRRQSAEQRLPQGQRHPADEPVPAPPRQQLRPSLRRQADIRHLELAHLTPRSGP